MLTKMMPVRSVGGRKSSRKSPSETDVPVEQQTGLQVMTMLKFRQKALNVKKVAMEKLEHGKTLDYNADELAKMTVAQLKATCQRYHVSVKSEKGTPFRNTLRESLAELLLKEKHRSDTFRKSKATQQGKEVEERTAEHLHK
jgi:hypothetical protein